jgi:hypothetical protein
MQLLYRLNGLSAKGGFQSGETLVASFAPGDLKFQTCFGGS